MAKTISKRCINFSKIVRVMSCLIARNAISRLFTGLGLFCEARKRKAQAKTCLSQQHGFSQPSIKHQPYHHPPSYCHPHNCKGFSVFPVFYNMRLSVLYLLHVLVAVSVIHADLSTCTAHPDGTSTAHTHTSAIPRSSSKKQIGGKARKALILDVDNCLYSESEIKAAGATGMGIEQQIIDRTHQFGEKELNLTKEECDNMYLSHGSTIEGIRHKLTSEGYAEERIRVVLSDYYQKVYDGIDMTCLLPLQSSINMNTGYNHARSRTRRRVIRDMLQHMPHPIYFASNSPKQHVLKVLSALGLKDVPYEGLLTPDTIHVGIGVGVGGDGDGGDGDGKVQKLDFPTKFHPSEFFQSLLDEYDAEEMILVDDSTNNLKKAKEIGIQGLQVNSNSAEGGLNLEEALSIFAGHVESGGEKDAYEFSDVKYLQSKNEVDKIAIHSDVWTQVSSRLFQNLSDNGNAVESCVRIVDVGAGLLSMLELVLVGGGGKESLVQHMKRGMTLEYIAYESNVNLIEACLGRLRALGFEGIPVGGIDSDDKEEYTFVKKAVAESDVEVKVILRVKDFAEHCLGKDERPHLIVGCCFADLFEPNELVSAIARFANYYTNGGGIGMDHSNNSNRLEEILVYFPITFSGTTQFVPPKPFEVNAGDDTIIPSDTIAFQLYADSLIQEHGHNLDPTAIVEAMKDVGASMIKSATSVWHIDPTENSYLWNTMLYFFGNSAAPQLMKRQLDSSGWVDRARTNRPIIRVMNQDLLFALPATGADSSSLRADVEQEEITCEEPSASAAARKTMQEIEFQSPNKVGKKIRDIVQLGPGQVEGEIFDSTRTDAFYVYRTYIKFTSQ